MALGATGCQPPSASGTYRSESQGLSIDVLRPAWASWMAGTAPCALMAAVMRVNASCWRSFHRPRSQGVMRPSGRTAVASAMTRPAPPTARAARWVRWKSVGTPVSGPWAAAEYMHIGDIHTRLGI